MRPGGAGRPRRTPRCPGRPSSRVARASGSWREGPLCGLVGLRGLTERAHGLLPRLARRPIQDQDPVQVVDLMLDHPRLESRGLDEHRLAGVVTAPNAHMYRSFHVQVNPGKAEASLL